MEQEKQLVAAQRTFFYTGQTKPIEYRIRALQQLRQGIEKYQQRILDALRADLNKSETEAYGSEIRIVLGELDFALEHLEEWATPKPVPTNSAIPHGTSLIYPEPYGVALIIAPWNYPFQLAFGPLIGAIAAGNCAIIKPSELTPSVSRLTYDLINEIFPKEYVAVMEGEVETSTALLKEKFDYIFFTGSTGVGRIVMKAAAEHLTPVTLELGGKSPVIVNQDADLKLAAQRIVRGKFLNAGQTCVAPDYLLVHENVHDKLLELIDAEIQDKFGDDVMQNADFLRRPKPLALYLFTKDEALQDQVLNQVSFGGGCINDTLSHMTSHYLPFGGVGESGMGSYHGQQSFDVFSHHKSILKRSE
ncbi:hypothetical protein B2I21_21515 [Chryseobacterium mucoviscidosis]|nr:hypothetical protein B2I21_21515 [Chryseobacterium mucoviscidosis]